MDVKSTWDLTWHRMDHVSWFLGLFSKLPLGGRRPWHSECSQPLVYFILLCVRTHKNRKFTNTRFGCGLGHIRLHTTLEGPAPHYTVLETSWDGLWTLSFGLSQFHGHGSWLMCEVALTLCWIKKVPNPQLFALCWYFHLLISTKLNPIGLPWTLRKVQ
jgi:hypothetical protein